MQNGLVQSFNGSFRDEYMELSSRVATVLLAGTAVVRGHDGVDRFIAIDVASNNASVGADVGTVPTQ